MLEFNPQEKIIEFLNEEFIKIKTQSLLWRANRKFKPQIIKKKVRKLQQNIELILKTNSLNGEFRVKAMALQQEMEDYLSK